MKVLHIRHILEGFNPGLGGPVRSVSALCRAQVKRGHLLEVCYLSHARQDRLPLLGGCSTNGFHQVKWGGGISGKFKSFIRSAQSVDITHLNGLWLLHYKHAADGALKRKEAYVVSPRGMLQPDALKVSKWKKRLAWLVYQRRLLQSATGLHATSEAEATNLRRLKLKPPIAVIPNPVEIPQFTQTQFNKKPLEVANRRRIALYLGRLHPIKGLEKLIRAWAKVGKNLREGWVLILAGPDERGYQFDLKELTKELGLTKDVVFWGQISDEEKWCWYWAADFVLLPSKSENFGLSAAEGLAAGRPVMASQGTPWSVLEFRGCGWWVPLDEEAWVRNLNVVLSMERDVLDNMGEKGRMFVSEHMTPEKIAEQMDSFYYWLLGVGEQPTCVYRRLS